MIDQHCCNTFSIEEISFLLGRKVSPISWDSTLEKSLKNKVVLITGAGGSIGTCLIKSTLPYLPNRIIALDHNEKALFDLKRKLSSEDRNMAVNYFLGDIKNVHAMKQLFFSYHPQIVIHAAAYKHVSLMQTYFREAIRNNVLGTKILVDAAIENEVEHFVFISTDKAVNPTSVMGATKRLGELYTLGMSEEYDGQTNFIVTRFGNVFHSSGSVIDVFLDQLKKGECLTLTDPKAERFFITVSEAADLILRSLCESNHSKSQLYVLKRGEPVKIKELTERLIDIFFQAKKSMPVALTFVGLGQGEKIKEQLYYEYEILQATSNPYIFKVHTPSIGDKNMNSIIRTLTQLKEGGGAVDTLNTLMGQMIPEYLPVC